MENGLATEMESNGIDLWVAEGNYTEATHRGVATRTETENRVATGTESEIWAGD